jgi:hypothetical protein
LAAGSAAEEIKVEYVEPGGREPEFANIVKCESVQQLAVKQELEANERINVKIERGLAADYACSEAVDSSFVAAKLEVVIKEEPAEEDDGNEPFPRVRNEIAAAATTAIKVETLCSTSEMALANGSSVKVEQGEEDVVMSTREQARLRRLDRLRPWAPTGLGRELQSGQRRPWPASMGFRLLSYNILAPCHLAERRRQQQQRLFRSRTASVLDWSNRVRGILREVDVLRPDVVCLQEAPFSADNRVHADLADYFSGHGYECVGHERRPGAAHGCAIFYRTALFSLEASKVVESRVQQPPHEQRRRRRIVGVVCRLRPVDSSTAVQSRLVVASVHLRQGQRHFVSRLADTAVLLAGKKNTFNIPVFFKKRLWSSYR